MQWQLYKNCSQETASQPPQPSPSELKCVSGGTIHFLPPGGIPHKGSTPLWNCLGSSSLFLPDILCLDSCGGCVVVHQAGDSIKRSVPDIKIHTEGWTPSLE